MASSPGTNRPPLRRDAEANRRRILVAAREVFRERGVEASLSDIAAHAGLGLGTVYRRFSSKAELVDALFDDMVGTLAGVAEEGLADPDAWRGLVTSLEKACEVQAFDRGLREVMMGAGESPERQALVLARITPVMHALITRAQEQGALRADISPVDIPMIQLMLAAVTDRTGQPDLWRRYLRLLLDGLRAQPGASAPLPDIAIGDSEFMNAMDESSAREVRERRTSP
ncbi:TetR/AcrR family transcriptional regulator [Streptomyces sp. NPDC058274]|jgi:AcrR family transcriptional regulator|uniref:TetR/AcrR family transcriptional regulator n=1 Tax=Streptomyces sp. NPDC058274 TaxID=3346416 RepID=UPI0036E34FF9